MTKPIDKNVRSGDRVQAEYEGSAVTGQVVHREGGNVLLRVETSSKTEVVRPNQLVTLPVPA